VETLRVVSWGAAWRKTRKPKSTHDSGSESYEILSLFSSSSRIFSSVFWLVVLLSICDAPSSLLLAVSAIDDALLWRRRFVVSALGRSFPSPFELLSISVRNRLL